MRNTPTLTKPKGLNTFTFLKHFRREKPKGLKDNSNKKLFAHLKEKNVRGYVIK